MHRTPSGGEADGPAEAAAPGTAVQRGRHYARLPPSEHCGNVQQLPGERRAVGGDGVPRGRCTDRHCDPLAHGRGANRNCVQAVPESALVSSFTGEAFS